jgi:putative transposase
MGGRYSSGAAIDVDTKELLAVYASYYYRSHINTLVFLKRVLDTCINKPVVVLVDGGPWYPWPLDRMGLRWLHVTFGYRNAIERFFRTLKERTRRFYNNLTSERLDSLQSFMNMFMAWYTISEDIRDWEGFLRRWAYRNSIL